MPTPHTADARLQPCAQLTLGELLNVHHQVRRGVVQADLPAPGCEPLRAADTNVEGLLARTVWRANEHACDERERLGPGRKRRRVRFKV
jgi:hypothetical protein